MPIGAAGAITVFNRTPPTDGDNVSLSISPYLSENTLQAPHRIQQMALMGGPEYKRAPP